MPSWAGPSSCQLSSLLAEQSRYSAAMCMLDTPTCPGPGTLDWVYKSPAPYVTTLLRHLCMLLTPFLRSPLNKLDRALCLLAGRPAQRRCLASAAKRAGRLLSQGPGCMCEAAAAAEYRAFLTLQTCECL